MAFETGNLWSPAAEKLVLGTALMESGPAGDLRRPGALGIYGIEPEEHRRLWEWARNHDDVARFLSSITPWHRGTLQTAPEPNDTRPGVRILFGWPKDDALVWNLAYATAVCRLLYRDVAPEALMDDLETLAACWEEYHGGRGRGRKAEFVETYHIEAGLDWRDPSW
jgi:hypothetical protein